MCVAPRTQHALAVHVDEHRGDLEQRIGGGVKAAGLHVDRPPAESRESAATMRAAAAAGTAGAAAKAGSGSLVGRFQTQRRHGAMRQGSRCRLRAAARAPRAERIACRHAQGSRSRVMVPLVARQAVEVGAVNRRQIPPAVASAPALAKTSAYSSMPACAENMPAQPQAASLAARACGALSVPRKSRGLPRAAASSSASAIALPLFRTGRQ